MTTNLLPNPSPLFRYANRPYGGTSITEVLIGDKVPLGLAPRGALFLLENGEEAHLFKRNRKNSWLRTVDSQEIAVVPITVELTVLDYRTWHGGLPDVGDVVQQRGEPGAALGVVSRRGLNSTHVLYPGIRKPVKYSASKLVILKEARITAEPIG